MRTYDIVKSKVSIYDLFDIADPVVTYLTKEKPCQISCPFHGQDAHPSARVYPDSNSFRCFTCSKSWNCVTFWAEAHNWFTESGTLDIGRALDDLCARFDISDTSFDWEKKFYALKQADTKQEVPDEDRYKLSAYYAWTISQLVHNISLERRSSSAQSILQMWSDFDEIDLLSAGWQETLINWYKSAKVIVHAEL